MAAIKRFEDIESWQLARVFCQWLFGLMESSPLINDFALKNQIDRSSGSIMDNIAEGFERNGNREFIQYLSTAKASCGEVRSQLYRIFDRKYVGQDEFEKKREELEIISKKISGLMYYLKQAEQKGWKFMEDSAEYGTTENTIG